MRCLSLIALTTALTVALPASGVERLTVQAGSVVVAGIVARDVTATLSIRSETQSLISVHAADVQVPAALAARIGPTIDLRVDCKDPVIHEPVFDCRSVALQARAKKWPQVTLRGAVAYRSDSGSLTAQGTGPDLVGSPVKFDIRMGNDATRAKLDLPSVSLPELLAFLKPWVTLPGDLQISGAGALSAVLERTGSTDNVTIALIVKQAAMQNAASTLLGEKIEASVNGRLDLSHPDKPMDFELEAHGTHGQFLGGPVLLDFDRNPLTLQAAGSWGNDTLLVRSFESTQRELLTANGSAEIGLAPLHVRSAEIIASEITFPAAYTSYLQLTLTTTPFNQLVTEGKARASLRIKDDQPVQVTLGVDGLGFSDDARELRVTGVRSELYWSAGATGPPRPSFLSWDSSRGWGMVGAQSRVDFITRDRDFSLLNPARLPLFDGALLINALSVQNMGQADMAGNFDAVVEPVSVAPIAKALGWPEFAGQISGRIPGLTYRDSVLSLEGNLEANVFDGQVVASHLRVRDPLGKWPRLYGDVTARNLDLELITRTIEFGSITGRLDVDLTGLETFDWSPVAFDLRMATPRGDRSAHRISQRAVQNLSNIGGGGGGVTATLQSGFLQFFDTFRYDRIGLSCRLRNDVCQMSGVGPAKGGYYIVRGGGLPRLDIIGRSTLVDWPRLVAQVTSAINNSEGIVVK